MKFFKRLIFICMICLMLCGCSVTLTNCKVVDKAHRNAYSTVVPICNGRTVILIPQYHPERWYVTIEGEDEDGDIRHITVDVDEAIYNQIVIGQKWVQENNE